MGGFRLFYTLGEAYMGGFSFFTPPQGGTLGGGLASFTPPPGRHMVGF